MCTAFSKRSTILLSSTFIQTFTKNGLSFQKITWNGYDSIAAYVHSCHIHVDTLTFWNIGEHSTTSEGTLTHMPLPLYWHIFLNNFVSPSSVCTILQCFPLGVYEYVG